jgi:hypothetical protein
MARWSKENPAPYMPNAAGNNGAARVKLQRKYFDALLADFAEYGEAATKIMRIEEPSAYIRVIASLMPKEFTVTDNALGDMSDEDLQQTSWPSRFSNQRPSIIGSVCWERKREGGRVRA